MSESIAADLNETTEQVVRLPSGVLRLVRESYDSRERVLDWMLAFFVSGALIYVFWDQLSSLASPSKSANAGLPDVIPNNDIKNAVGNGQPVGNYFTYNMPTSRQYASRIGNANTRIPFNPADGPQYSFPEQPGSTS